LPIHAGKGYHDCGRDSNTDVEVSIEAAAVPTKLPPFGAEQFSLFPENCSDWSIEMKWAEDITPRMRNS
jgi:hypothetical protein